MLGPCTLLVLATLGGVTVSPGLRIMRLGLPSAYTVPSCAVVIGPTTFRQLYFSREPSGLIRPSVLLVVVYQRLWSWATCRPFGFSFWMSMDVNAPFLKRPSLFRATIENHTVSSLATRTCLGWACGSGMS